MAAIVDQSDELIYEEEEDDDLNVERDVRDTEEMEEGEISGPEDFPGKRAPVAEKPEEPNFRPPLFSKSARLGLQITIGNTKHLPVSPGAFIKNKFRPYSVT